MVKAYYGGMNAIFLTLFWILASAQDRPIDRAKFLQGCWERRAGARIVEEQWMAPRAGTMLGMSRTIRGDTLVEHEFLLLHERDGKLVYAARPSGQAPAEFISISIASDVIVFSNPAHDFPQRIIYRQSGDSLFARIEGVRDGRERGVDFRYARVRCP
jgi:hypothetical protein